MSSLPTSLPALPVELAACDKLLIVAAAGLSISTDLPNNPYHSSRDFQYHYPLLVKAGYQTSYHAMGVSRDPRVPESVKVGYLVQHFLNMRFRFPPTPAYAWLKHLAVSFENRDPDAVFCWTSNVDGCFERAGFDPGRVWTTQGDMTNYQCLRCKNVWNCAAELRNMDAACSPEGELTDMSLCLTCPKCGASRAELRPSLRGGDWFDHTPYQEKQDALLAWLDAAIQNKSKVAVLEIGVGPNTPVVTRIPAAAFASALVAGGGECTYVRINPDERPEPASQNPQGDPERLRFTRVCAGWDVLKPILDETIKLRCEREDTTGQNTSQKNADADEEAVAAWQGRYLDIARSLQ
jgi:NAD-dependent SIR2 family protein deacetylase